MFCSPSWFTQLFPQLLPLLSLLTLLTIVACEASLRWLHVPIYMAMYTGESTREKYRKPKLKRTPLYGCCNDLCEPNEARSESLYLLRDKEFLKKAKNTLTYNTTLSHPHVWDRPFTISRSEVARDTSMSHN